MDVSWGQYWHAFAETVDDAPLRVRAVLRLIGDLTFEAGDDPLSDLYAGIEALTNREIGHAMALAGRAHQQHADASEGLRERFANVLWLLVAERTRRLDGPGALGLTAWLRAGRPNEWGGTDDGDEDWQKP